MSIFNKVKDTIKWGKYKRKACFSFYFRARVSSAKPEIQIIERKAKFWSSEYKENLFLWWVTTKLSSDKFIWAFPNWRTSESRAKLVLAMPSEEEEDEVNREYLRCETSKEWGRGNVAIAKVASKREESHACIIINYQFSILNLLRSNIDLFERSESRSTVFQNRNLFWLEACNELSLAYFSLSVQREVEKTTMNYELWTKHRGWGGCEKNYYKIIP